jgi:hypothetical protein
MQTPYLNTALFASSQTRRSVRAEIPGSVEPVRLSLCRSDSFGGLTPIILERSQQANYLIPMAISPGFGILFATSIILVIVPCLYMVLEDLLVRIRN